MSLNNFLFAELFRTFKQRKTHSLKIERLKLSKKTQLLVKK